ncbi:MAG: DUF4105 domain-containing protein [Kiritimatiellae bacterium]|nr:DUF4105 domain-containing protein [Kiritimatiellia bacterium]
MNGLGMSALFALVATGALPLFAAPQKPAPSPNAGFNDGIDRTDPDFVTASLLVMSPGDALYSCAGHTCIRLECPKFNLDFCFSYESEGVTDKIFTFFMGKLKMGMFAVPTADYLKLGRESGRGVMQYTLNLPPDAKQRLWKLLDSKVAEGPCLEYDYMERGCAQAAMKVLREAANPYEMQVAEWPEKYATHSRHELLEEAITAYPWQTFLLYTICGATTDDDMSKFRKVVIPRDLLAILKIAKIGNEPIITDDGVELLPVKGDSGKSRPLFTPFIVALLALAAAVLNFFARFTWLNIVFIVFQSVLGLFLTYMVCFSNLTAMGWNWLIVPFNLLPLLFWKWRAKWALWFAAVLVLWEIGMIAYPHRLTDPAYLVLVAAYIVMFTRIGWHGRTGCPQPAVSAKAPTCRSCADIFEQLRRDNEAARRARV